jgi:LmbE family N-acetylglucosaminyl deacetylase
MAHLFLSPHMDDAVLSCGGLIYQLTHAGEAVIVVSVMAGNVPPDVVISPFIEEHFRRWELWPDPVPERKTEDTQAVRSLGADVRFGDVPDALYRTDGQGVSMYPDLATLFGEIDPRDPVLEQMHKITDWLDPAATVYAPLGAGHHVDHQLVRNAVIRWLRAQPEVAVFLYEEYPYSAESAEAVQAACHALGELTVPVVHHMSGLALEAKIRAIACYRSQISTFWDDVLVMGESVWKYAYQVGQGRCAERLWRLVREGKSHE